MMRKTGHGLAVRLIILEAVLNFITHHIVPAKQ